MTPAECVIDTFGGIRATARILQINASTVCRWLQPRKSGKAIGRVPMTYEGIILTEAAKRGKHLTLEHLIRGKPGIVRTVVRRL